MNCKPQIHLEELLCELEIVEWKVSFILVELEYGFHVFSPSHCKFPLPRI
jgi:hypothetical protein